MSLGTFIYRLVKRFIPLDSTHIFLFSPNTAGSRIKVASSSPSAEISCRMLSKDDLRRLSSEPVFSISPQFLADAQTYNFQVVGVLLGKDMAGVCCFARNNVPAHLNTGGNQFNGIGLTLPSNAIYLFKVFVKSEYRGKRLVGEMLNFGLQSNEVALNKTLVTTTDITNVSFINAIERMGFERVGHAMEAIVFGKHYFKLPPPIEVPQAHAEGTTDQVIVLVNPAA